jgi:predicted acylesterase/phospholipase RssA
MDTNTVRILSLDGGGVRGYLSLKFLQRFIQQWGINPNELWKYFDVITGTSIGGIQALGYAYGRSPEYLEPFFKDQAKRVFTIRSILDIGQCNTNYDSNRPSIAQKVILIGQNDPFYKSACAPDEGNSNYGSNILHNVLVDNFGTDKLSDLKTKVIIPAYQDDTSTYVNFSNYSNSNMFIGSEAQIVDVARATSAAPVYLPSYSFGTPEHRYIDGGVYQNNPSEIALSLGKALKPTANRACVLSLGTGIGEMGFDEVNTFLKSSEASNADSGIARIFSLFDIASTGGQESVDFNLKFRANNTLEQLYYYRFQPKLDTNLDTELDNSDVAFLDYMETTANTHFNNDTDNINNFLGHLTA